MSSPIEPTRPSAAVRRAERSERRAVRRNERSQEETTLPVVAEAAPPPAPEPADGPAAFKAQLLGQDGQKRGLRGGPAVLDAAKSTYNRIEWSGPADRRARKGGAAKTEI